MTGPKPQITKEKLLKLLTKYDVNLEKEKFLIFGIRGYYLNTYGVKGKNDRGVWDDAIGMIDINGNYVVFRANVDPSSVRKGRGTGAGKGMASLKAMFHKDMWMVGRHKKIYPALRQASAVTVIRDGLDGPYEDTGTSFMINGHPGGAVGTSSAGCQTFMRSDWPAAIAFVVSEMKKFEKTRVSYLLMENDGSIA